MAQWSWNKLYQSGQRLAPWRRNYSSSPQRTLEGIIPYVGTHVAVFQFTMHGVTQRAIHHVTLVFEGLDIKERPDLQDQISKVKTHTSKDMKVNGVLNLTDKSILCTYKGKVYEVEKPNMYKTSCRIRCTCHDFYFTFGWWDYNEGALAGPRPKPYRRKTTWWPERNPQHVPGLCKHIYNSAALLVSSNMTNNLV